VLVQSSTATLTVGNSYTLALTTTSVGITLNVNGVIVCSHTDTTISPTMANCLAGVYANHPTGGTGFKLLAFSASDEIALTHSDLFDNNYSNSVGGNYTRSSEFAFARFTTDATGVTINTYMDWPAVVTPYNQIGVRSIDSSGVVTEYTIDTNIGAQTLAQDLAGGSQTVEIVSGPQSNYSGSSISGSWLKAVAFTGATTTTLVTPTSTNRLVIYGDSIASGDACNAPVLENWPCLLRNNGVYAGNVAVEAYGAWALFSDAPSGNASTLVSQISGYSPSRVWIAVGAMDYILNFWSAASFGSAYQDLLDRLHGLASPPVIYCQTPLVEGNESANGHGSTLGDYRAAIVTACSTRSWANLVNGTQILNLADLDATHVVYPTTFGTDKYHSFVEGAMLFLPP